MITEHRDRLRGASVFVIGAGSLGGVSAGYVGAAGVGRVAIVDGGQVEAAGLHRQLMSYAPEVGSGIADAVVAKLTLINPEAHVEAYPANVDESNVEPILAAAGCVLDCANSSQTRLLVNDACLRLGVPLISAGTSAAGGWLMTVIPGRTACLRCAAAEFPDIDAVEDDALGPVAGAIGSLSALGAVKLITGLGSPRAGELLTFSGDRLELHGKPVARRRDCICARRADADNV